jgi:nucleoside-diphosphate-sugar epimerase
MSQSQKFPYPLPAADLAEVVRRAEADLRELRGRNIFITGGTGFFGKWLLGTLLHASDELKLGLHVTVLSRDPARFVALHPGFGAHPALRFQAGHVAEFESDAEHYDFVLHAAADTTAITTGAQEEERSRAMIEGTRRMLALARESGARRLLYVSSGAVYGAAAGKLSGASENDFAAAVPVTAYARAKREAERLCGESGLDFVTARAFAFLGPHLPLDAHYAAGNFLRDARGGGPIVVRGDGTAVRSYLYPTDLIVWLLRLLLRGERGRAYNVGSDEAVTTAELARRVAAACPSAPEVRIEASQPQGPQNIYLPDVTRARTELGLAVNVPLDEAIRRTLNFL